MALLFTSLVYVVTAVGRIRIVQQCVWRVLFLVFLTLFLSIAFLSVWFTVICIIRKIIFVRWWVWQWWVWLWVSYSVGCVGDSVVRIDKSVGCVIGVGSGIFVLTGIKSIGDVVPLVVFVPKVVESKGGRLIEIFWRPKSWFSLLVSK